MERKIGEIFEYNGEWYQRVEGDSCGECSLFATECRSGTKSDLADKVFGQCSKLRRTDKKHVIFKKLEKVGEPYIIGNKLIQRYKIYPTRGKKLIFWYDEVEDGGIVYDTEISLPKGSIKKLIGRDLTWEDEPVELRNE